ncbi:hypothetical protein FGG08_004286 [Glutinoglossum americanum]|uniref:Uncharacterized protein n=1 Tax=Glutinoglossum americanum TaxID=1670608 RepID=A0A9P8I7W2_9PEZI|nr:hypothetical protein FGG08_004286 [Glutinoglossum americanum]
MGLISAATRSPRVASLEATKQIQKDAVKRHRGPRVRNANDEIGDTIIVAAPNLRAIQRKKLEGRESRLLITSIRVPPSPTPSSSPSPKKRKASALEGEILSAGTGQLIKRSNSMSRSPDPDSAENLTPPVTPQVASNDMDLDEELQHHQRPQNMNASTEWPKASLVWVDLVGEDACVDSLKATAAAEPPKSVSSTGARASRLVCLYLGRHGQELRKYSSLSAKGFGASGETREIVDAAKSLDGQKQQGGRDCEDNEDCNALMEAAPLLCDNGGSAYGLQHSNSEASAEVSLASLPRLTINTSASIVPAPPQRIIASPENDFKISSLSLQSPGMALAPPVEATIVENDEPHKEECDQDRDLELQHDDFLPPKEGVDLDTTLLGVHDIEVGGDGPSGEPGDDGGGDAMEGVVLDYTVTSPTILESGERSNPKEDVEGPSNNDKMEETRTDAVPSPVNPDDIASPVLGVKEDGDVMEATTSLKRSPTPLIEDSTFLVTAFGGQDTLLPESLSPNNYLPRVTSPILGIEDIHPEVDNLPSEPPTTTPEEQQQQQPFIPSTPSSASEHTPEPNDDDDSDDSDAHPPPTPPSREESVTLTPQPYSSTGSPDPEESRVIINVDSNETEERAPPPPPQRASPPTLPTHTPASASPSTSMPPPPPPRIISPMPPPPTPTMPRAYRAIQPRPMHSASSPVGQRGGYGYAHWRQNGGMKGAGAGRRERISIEELLNGW